MLKTWILGLSVVATAISAYGSNKPLAQKPPFLSEAERTKFEKIITSEDKTFSEASLPFCSSPAWIRRLTRTLNRVEEEATAIKIFRIAMAPNETIHFSLKAEGESVILGGYRHVMGSPMDSAIHKANMAPLAHRAQRYSISNPSNQSQDFVLLAYGKHGYPYTLSIERK